MTLKQKYGTALRDINMIQNISSFVHLGQIFTAIEVTNKYIQALFTFSFEQKTQTLISCLPKKPYLSSIQQINDRHKNDMTHS